MMTSAIEPRSANAATPTAPARAAGLSPATRSVALAGEHFAAAAVYLLAGAVGLVWIAPDLARGNYLAPRVAGVTHLFTLGWLTMAIFGALYQLLPVALGAPIRWPRVGRASFWTFAPGVGLFACGVADSAPRVQHAGIGLLSIGIVFAVANIGATLPRARRRDVTWAAILSAITFLSSTLLLGLVLLHNLHSGFIAAARVHVLATHLHVAIVGWVLVTIVGVSHRLLPMFILAHGADTRWTKRALILLVAGVPALAVGLNTRFTAAAWLGVGLLELGFLCYLRQAYAFYRARVRKQIDPGMRFVAAALTFLVVAAMLGPVLLAVGTSASRLATAYVLSGLLGGVAMYVVGFFYKIVPLLSWTAHYRGQMSRPGVPTVAEMYSARAARMQLILMATAVTLVLLAIAAVSTIAAYAGAALFFGGVLVFVVQLAVVARGGPRREPRDARDVAA
jgi:hypothetical protein